MEGLPSGQRFGAGSKISSRATSSGWMETNFEINKWITVIKKMLPPSSYTVVDYFPRTAVLFLTSCTFFTPLYPPVSFFFHPSGPVHTKPYLAARRRTLMHLMFVEELAAARNSCSEKEKQEACEITSTHRRAHTHTELRPQLVNFLLAVNNGAIFLLSLCLRAIFIFDFLIMHQI